MDESSKGSAMLPDSTQSGTTNVAKRKTGKKRKKKDGTGRKKIKGGRVKDQKAKADGGPINDDLDLTKPLFTISHYISDREEMLQQAFQSVSKEQIDAMLPEVLKSSSFLSEELERDFRLIEDLPDGLNGDLFSATVMLTCCKLNRTTKHISARAQDCPMDVVKALCLGQLEGMSKKRIFHVIAGEEMLSSSDTDESENENDAAQEQSQADTAEHSGDGLEAHPDGFEPQLEGFETQPEGFEAHAEGLDPQEARFDSQEIEFEPQEDGFEPREDGFEPRDDGLDPRREGVGPGDSPGGDQEMGISWEGTEHEPSFDNGDNDQMRAGGGSPGTPEPEMGTSPEYILDSSEEVQQDPPPVQKRRKKKRERKPRMVNPTDLEEGEVSMESSEYTDASDDGNDADPPDIEGAITANPPEVSGGAIPSSTVEDVSAQEETSRNDDNGTGDVVTEDVDVCETDSRAVEDGEANVERSSLVGIDNDGTTTANTASVDSVVNNVGSSAVISEDNTGGKQGATLGAIVGTPSVDTTNEGAVVDSDASSLVISDTIPTDELEKPTGADATVDTTSAGDDVNAVGSLPFRDGTPGDGVGSLESTNVGAAVAGKSSQDSAVCVVSSVSEMSDSSAPKLDVTSPGTASRAAHRPTQPGTTQTGEASVVYDVSSSEVEEREPDNKEVGETINLGQDEISQLAESIQAEMTAESDTRETADFGASSEQTAAHTKRGERSQNTVVVAGVETTEMVTEVEGDSLSVDNDSEFDEEDSEPAAGVASENPRGRTAGKLGESQSDRSSDEKVQPEQSEESEASSSESEGASAADEHSSSAASGGQEDASAKPPDLEQSSNDSQAQNPGSANNLDPKLNILELELRARAIRSLMKHCAAVEKLT